MFPIRPRYIPDPSAPRFRSAAPYDAVLQESEHFVCVPSLGSIVQGWVLVTPKQARLNMAQLSEPEREELPCFYEHVRSKVEEAFGRTCAFEHGAQAIGSATGCGVDQAHLHIVPISFEALLEDVRARASWNASAFRLPAQGNFGTREYLWISDSDRSYVAYPTEPVSQFFRRAVARVAGLADSWDYRANPFDEHIAETKRALAGRPEVPQSRAA